MIRTQVSSVDEEKAKAHRQHTVGGNAPNNVGGKQTQVAGECQT